MIEEAQKTIEAIRQMEASLDDLHPRGNHHQDDGLKVTFPLSQCLLVLQEKYGQIRRLHKDRFEQVKSQLRALSSDPS